MHSFVDFQVDWPKLLFKSRLQIPCRDIIHVATSISRRDINLSLCSFELVVHDVAKSISCRDISSYLCSFQLMSSVVATSILCRDITSCLHRFHWLLLVSRPPFLVATSTFVATSRCCRDIIPLVSAQSSAAYLVIPVATCIKFPSIFLMSRPHNWTVQTPKLQH